MAPEGTSDIVHILENNRQELHTAADGCPESQANSSPEAGRWSVLECVEHAATVEERLLGRLEHAELLDAPRIDKQREAELGALLINRSKRAQAPEAVRPARRFASLAAALDHFNAARARTIRFAEDRSADLYSLSAEHPRFGRVNGIEMLLIAAGHVRRHADQIREIRAALGKP